MPEVSPRPSLPWRAWSWLEGNTIWLPVSLLVFDLLGTWGSARGWHQQSHTRTHVRTLGPLAWLLVVAGPVALFHRRWAPRAALFITLGATLAFLLRGYPNGPVWLNAIVAVVGATGAGYRRAAWIAAVLFAGGLMFQPAYTPGESRLVGVLVILLWLVGIMLVPELIRVLRERAREAVRIKEEEARRQASDERLAIARELHDVLAHSVSLIAVQANVALEVMDRRPEQARIALVAIKDASKSALTEVRSVLDVLRGTEAAPRDPAPGLDRLAHLVTQAEAAGLRTTLRIVGDLATVPLAISQAGYRIVQESLTNVVRHAHATKASVLVECGEELRLRIVDDGRGAPLGFGGGTGNGLPGMKERAVAFGGELTAVPVLTGGFRVEARIPFPCGASARTAPTAQTGSPEPAEAARTATAHSTTLQTSTPPTPTPTPTPADLPEPS